MAWLRGTLGVLLLLAVAGAATVAPAAARTAPAAIRGRTALPADRLHFGLASGPDQLGWMTTSGVPWRYRYQYLAGGVNTGQGWETWNSPSGAFAAGYMSRSGAAGVIPVFTYYELLQSNPAALGGGDEAAKDLSNLQNPSTMNAYYSNFRLLMQLAAAYGRQVVVHVEPDFWGYLQQQGKPASSIPASVAGSGDADESGLPDTAQGFAWALLRLRDRYAPNVLMAVHASPWAAGRDISSDTDSTLDALGQADATAAFLNSLGISSNPYGSTWDLVFNDLDDHDAGWWEQQGKDSQWFTHWWDPGNVNFPNFRRYLDWVGELHTRTGLPQVAWQVPLGNQYYLTMNNTTGHYQDNVAPYFLNHPSELWAAGLIAVLFGSGNGGQATNTDAQGDGVTNNGGQPTSDPLGYCNGCNIQTSVWPDDDGGYLRTFGGRYYQSTGCGTAALTVLAQEPLGGGLTSAPAAASWAPDRLDVFGRGSDGALWHDSWGGAWAGWDSLGGGLKGAPAAVSWASGRIDVFVRGNDDGLWHRFWAGAWSGWEPLGGALTSAPAVASWAPGRLDIVVRGSDGGLWHKWWDGSGWSGFQALGGQLTADPAAVSWGPNRLDLFVRGVGGGLWHQWWDGSAWSGWTGVGGTLTSAPAADSCAPGRLDVVALGNGSGLWHTSWSGAWNGWQSLGGSWTQGPASVARFADVDLFTVAPDGTLSHGTAG